MAEFLRSNPKKDTETKIKFESNKKEFSNVKYLGGGGFGNVFEVEDNVNGHHAIKQIKLDEIKYLERETKIKDFEHKNIVKYFGFWLERNCNQDAYLFIQMELCCKDNLAVWLLKSDEHVRKDRFHSIFREIVEAVAYIHSKELIHRDLKPENVLFSLDGGTIKLADFGSIVKHGNLDKGGTIHTGKKAYIIHTNYVGTLWYEAPEVEGRKYDFKADIFSLGVILFELITPFKIGDDRDAAIEKLRNSPFPKHVDPKIKKEFDLMKQMLSKNPKKRPTIAKIKNHLTEWKTTAVSSSSTFSIAKFFEVLAAFLNNIKMVDVITIQETVLVSKQYKIESKNPRQKMKKDHKMLQ